MKICIATDFHLSYRQYGLEEREQDFYKQYDKLIDRVINEKPNLFLILGDIFDTPYPKPISIKRFEDGLNKLQQAKIKTYGILGNHTIIQRKDFYPIDKIFDDKYHILDDDYIILDDIFIGGIGYHPRTHNIKKIIDTFSEKAENCKLKILLLHQILKKDQPIGYDYDEEDLCLDRFDYVFLGHLHKRTTRWTDNTTIHYVGSLNSCNVTELLDEMTYGKGYTVLNTDIMELYHKTITPQREYIGYTLTDDDLNRNFIENKTEFLKTKAVKPIIQINIIGTPSFDVYDIKRKLESVSLIVRQKMLMQNSLESQQMTEDRKLNWGKDAIEEMLQSSFDDDWKGKLAVDLFRALSKGDIESAKQISSDVFDEMYEHTT